MLYRFGDWTISCPIELPDLIPVSTAADPHVSVDDRHDPLQPDLSLRVLPADQPMSRPHRWLHHWLDTAGDRTLSVARRTDGTMQLRFPGVFDAHLDLRARTLDLQLIQGCRPATCRHLLIDQLLPRIRASLDALVMHACAVRIGETAILIAGESGWGKSTLAASLHACGHVVLSDDCVILAQADGEVRVRPTYPSLRLLPDSVTLLEDPELATMTEESSKQRIRLPFQHGLIDARAIALYLLKAPGSSQQSIDIQPLSAGQECIELLRHSFVLDVDDRARLVRQLQSASSVAQRLPAFTLDYPRAYERLPHVVECLVAHSQLLATPSASAVSD